MRKQTKKIAFSVLFSMAMSLVAPSQLSAFAATKTFEYVDETTEESIKELALTKGEQVDLKPIGVSSYSNAKWTSSNTKVAVVDSKGMITAMAEGETTIKMTIGDGSDYTSTPVKVFVKDDREVTIGVSEEVFGYEMKNGTSVDFQFFGLLDGAESRYECEWTSTNPSVATVDSATGEVTAKNEGFTVLGLTLTNKNTKKEYEATPIAISVVKGTGISIATPTPKPSGIVRVTPTPKPTSVPSATATPTPVVTQEPEATVTPTPALEKVAYTANLVADNCILLDFLNKKVDYSELKIELHKIVELPDDYMTVMVSMESKLASNGTQINIYPADGEAFENNVKYIVKVNGEEKIINVAIGAPNRVEVSYECLGEDGKAYYYDEAMGLEVPVTLSYQLYYNMVNVTESYKNKGYIEYEFLKEYENVDLNEDVLNFYAKTYVTLKATFYYSDDDGEYKECKNTKPISIAAVKLPSYKVDGLVNWTIIDTEETTKINWDKPVQYTIAGAENQKVVALIADNYGKYYVTDERGVDEDKGIYYVGDGEQLFSIMGYRTEFNFKISESDFVIESDGSLLTYETVKQGNATLEIWYDANETKKEYAIYPLQVKEPRKLNGIQAEKTSVTLATSSISGYEDKFSQTQVEIILKDQYGKEWTGDYDLELTSNVTEVNDALNGSASDPAYLDGTTLYINAENIMEVTNRTNVSFTVTETETKRTAKVTVTLKKPKFADGGEIVVNSSQIGLKETTIPLIDVTGENEIAAAQLEIYKISNGVKVGLYDASQIVIQESANHKFTVDNCTAGQVYVLVLGPDKKPVKEAESVDSVGVWIDSSEDCVMINVSGKKEGDNSSLEFLQKGTYTVKVTSITSVTSNKVNKANVTPTSLYFTVEDNTSDVTFQSLRNKTTSIVVNSKDDKESVKQIVAELFRFRLGNKEWSDLTQDMITDVKFTVSKEYLVIHDVEFAIPYPGEDSNMSYQKVITGLNKAVSFDN